jgi:hypothetical protein
VITSKPATHDHFKTGQRTNPGHKLLYRADRSSGKDFFGVQRRKIYFDGRKIPQACSSIA